MPATLVRPAFEGNVDGALPTPNKGYVDSELAVLEAWRTQERGKRLRAHNARLSFAEKGLAVVVAWALAQLLFEALLLAATRNKEMTEEDLALIKLLMRAIYAVVVSFACPVIAWALRGSICNGESIWRDWLKLVKKSITMTLAWGWKDFIHQAITTAGGEWTHALIFASSLTLVLAVLEATGCYARSRAAVQAGGAQDTIVRRLLCTPGALTLALGFAWNAVATFPITWLQEKANSKHLHFLIQLCYYTLIVGAATSLTKWLDKRKQRTGDCEVSTPGPVASVCNVLEEIEDEFWEVEGAMLQLLASSVAFVCAFALSDLLSVFYFGLMHNCGGTVACSYQSHFVYAIILTVVFSWVQSDCTALQMHVTSVATALAWSGYAAASAGDVSSNDEVDRVTCYLVLNVLAWGCGTLVYHAMERYHRAWEKRRAAEDLELCQRQKG